MNYYFKVAITSFLIFLLFNVFCSLANVLIDDATGPGLVGGCIGFCFVTVTIGSLIVAVVSGIIGLWLIS